MDLSQTVHDAAQEVLAAPAPSLIEHLNTFVSQFIGWPFMVSPGFVVDGENRTDTFACVVHTSSVVKGGPNKGGFPSDGVAAVIDASESLNLEGLRLAYERIAQAKRLKKNPSPKDILVNTATLGIIFTKRSDVPIEVLGEELDNLNATSPGEERPDMLVVASTGVINYEVQFPGEEKFSGDFLPPAEGALIAYTPAMYIVMVVWPLGEYSLNKMLAFLIAHLMIFSRGAKLPQWNEVFNGTNQSVVTLRGYQYNLRGELVRVPERFYNDRYIGPMPVNIEDRQGNVLAALRFLPWQDGAAISLEGKLPLERLLLFLEPNVLKRAGVINLKNRQISYVLPITDEHFQQMLRRIHQQSNMVVRPVQPDWTIRKVADEGTSSPFIARLMSGILHLRDMVFNSTDRVAFDMSYDFMLKSLFNSRDAWHRLARAWREHQQKVANGEVVRVRGNTIQVDESVDRELGKEVESFLNAASRALKKGMQDVASFMEVNIGFLFKRQSTFEAGLVALQKSDPELADYLRESRLWSERLQEARNALEHEGWMLPPVQYTHIGNRVEAIEPQIMGQPVTEFAKITFDRLTCFVEDVTAHLLKRRLPAFITLTEVPLAKRRTDIPERFEVTLVQGGMPPWIIAVHSSSFEQT